MFLKLSKVVAVAIFAVLAAGCQPVMPVSEPAQLANPASEHCVDQGGSLDIRTETDGGQVGYCQFSDGSECEEWSYFRGDCVPGEFPASAQLANPASVHCAEEGGTLEIRDEADGGQIGMCLFPDGSECEEWAFFRGECAPGGQ